MAWPFNPQIAPVAARQLATWEEIAADWTWRLRDARVAACSHCGKGIALVHDSDGKAYVYSEDQWRALVVLHLRAWHADLDPDQP